MNTNDVSNRTKEILNEYADVLGLPPSWNQSLSISDFLTIRNAAIDEISKNIHTIGNIEKAKEFNDNFDSKNTKNEQQKQNNFMQTHQITQAQKKVDSLVDSGIVFNEKINNEEIVENVKEEFIEKKEEIAKEEKTKEELELELFSKFQD